MDQMGSAQHSSYPSRMRKFFREHGNQLWSYIGGTAGLLGVIAILVPDFRDFFRDGWLGGWLLLFVSIIAASIIWLSADRQIQRLEADVDDLAANLKTKTNEVADKEITFQSLNEVIAERDAEIQVLTERRDGLNRSLEAARTQIRSLQVPVPTDRDKRLFAQLDAEWPWTTGTLWWLKIDFNAKSWGSAQARQLIEFVDIHDELYFDDLFVNGALQDFRSACSELVDWLVGESFPHDENPHLQYIPNGHERIGGWDSFNATRQNGFRYADAVVKNWRAFVKMGRNRGL